MKAAAILFVWLLMAGFWWAVVRGGMRRNARAMCAVPDCPNVCAEALPAAADFLCAQHWQQLPRPLATRIGYGRPGTVDNLKLQALHVIAARS